jgi:hypothetical protein
VPNPVTSVCTAITIKPTVGNVVLTELTTVLNNSTRIGQILPQTVAYVNNLSNQANLLGGGANCIQFFSGLQSSFFTDMSSSTNMLKIS